VLSERWSPLSAFNTSPLLSKILEAAAPGANPAKRKVQIVKQSIVILSGKADKSMFANKKVAQ